MAYVYKMVKPLAKWEMKRYSQLWAAFGKKPFANDDAKTTLRDKNHMLSVLFYNLKLKGWVDVNRLEEDMRKKTYTLREPNAVVKELANEHQSNHPIKSLSK